jgi:thioredoxin
MKKFMKKVVYCGLICCFLSGCIGQTSLAIQTIEAKSFAEKLKSIENPQLIDVRTPKEFETEKIENASNIDWNGIDFETKSKKLDVSKPIFVYCKVGGRSAKAAAKLAEMGFTKIYNLDGGIMKWNANGLGKSNGKIIGVCPQEFTEMLLKEPKILVSFYAKWCEPCHIMQPFIIKMQEQLKGEIKIIRLDADENKSVLDSLKLDGLPVILIYENGKETFRNIGFMTEEDIKKHL